MFIGHWIFSSVECLFKSLKFLLFFSHSVMSSCLWPHGLQHNRLPCPSLSPRVCTTHLSILWMMLSNYPILCCPFSSCPQSFPASGSFPMSRVFTLGGQSIGASASASVLPMNIQGWLPLGLPGFISLMSKGCSRVFSSTSLKASILWHSAFFMVQLSHLYVTAGKNIALSIQIFVSKVISLVFNTLSRFVVAFLPRSKGLLISWLQSLSAVILEPKKTKCVIGRDNLPFSM